MQVSGSAVIHSSSPLRSRTLPSSHLVLTGQNWHNAAPSERAFWRVQDLISITEELSPSS